MYLLNRLTKKMLHIESESMKIYLLLIPPFYGFWLFSIGQLIIKNRLLKLIISAFTFLFTFVLTSWFVLWPYSRLYKYLPIDMDFYTLFVLGYLIVIGIIFSILTLKFEKSKMKNSHQIPISFMDYYIRFFLLVNWLVGIWSLQRIVNKYGEDI